MESLVLSLHHHHNAPDEEEDAQEDEHDADDQLPVELLLDAPRRRRRPQGVRAVSARQAGARGRALVAGQRQAVEGDALAHHGLGEALHGLAVQVLHSEGEDGGAGPGGVSGRHRVAGRLHRLLEDAVDHARSLFNAHIRRQRGRDGELVDLTRVGGVLTDRRLVVHHEHVVRGVVLQVRGWHLHALIEHLHAQHAVRAQAVRVAHVVGRARAEPLLPAGHVHAVHAVAGRQRDGDGDGGGGGGGGVAGGHGVRGGADDLRLAGDDTLGVHGQAGGQ